MHYLKATQAAGTDEPLKVAAKMRDMPIEDFFAQNGRLREDGLMVHDLMLVQVKKPEDSKYPWDYYQILTRIPGEQAFGPPNPPVRWSRDERRLRGRVAQFAAVEIALCRALGRGFAGRAKSEKRKAGPEQP
jgi:substrate-binding family protein